eukprot:1163959-Rhodomonas_salina.3
MTFHFVSSPLSPVLPSLQLSCSWDHPRPPWIGERSPTNRAGLPLAKTKGWPSDPLPAQEKAVRAYA